MIGGRFILMFFSHNVYQQWIFATILFYKFIYKSAVIRLLVSNRTGNHVGVDFSTYII